MKRLFSSLLLATACMTLMSPQISQATQKKMAPEEIMVNGSTTVLPILQKVSESYVAANPGVEIALSGGGSGNGIKALIDGLTTIAMSSRDMKENEIQLAEKNKVQPKRFAVAIDALVPVVNPKNPVKELSLSQLQDIYTGKTVNWNQVGGNDAKIVVISRDSSSGTFECWQEMVMKKEKVMPGALLQASSGAVNQTVSKNVNAIGYNGIGYLDPSVKGLKIGNVTASAQTALSKQWPLSRELYVFTNGEPKGATAAFIAYLLDPQKGQKAVAETGFVPLPRK